MIKSLVKEIGPEATKADEPIIILFNETVTDSLKNYCVVHETEANAVFSLAEGNTISFGNQEYTIKKVGPMANKFLNEMGHVSIVFSAVPVEDELVNALYVEPFELPTISDGMVISYS